jgi:predicted amidohydrolase YtcJ
MREVNRLGVTGVIDAGGGFQNYPEDYSVIEDLHKEGNLTVRLAYNLFTQKPKAELNDFTTGRPPSSRARATTCIGTTALARCWSTPPPTSRTFASSGPTCRRRWRPISNR